MPLLGEHNVRNALVAIAIGVELGLDVERLRERRSRHSRA